MTVESQANFDFCVLVALVSLLVAVAALASGWMRRTNAAAVPRRERFATTDR